MKGIKTWGWRWDNNNKIQQQQQHYSHLRRQPPHPESTVRRRGWSEFRNRVPYPMTKSEREERRQDSTHHDDGKEKRKKSRGWIVSFHPEEQFWSQSTWVPIPRALPKKYAAAWVLQKITVSRHKSLCHGGCRRNPCIIYNSAISESRSVHGRQRTRTSTTGTIDGNLQLLLRVRSRRATNDFDWYKKSIASMIDMITYDCPQGRREETHRLVCVVGFDSYSTGW